ncbi:MAG TPA: dipeptidase, partial [Anaerolineales bacterium]|nr:dipeptidase [Anaerolineales bacterium]
GQILQNLKDFVAIPSISTDTEATPDIQRAAEWVAGQLQGMGIENVAILPTSGHPVVYGEWLNAGADRPTVLVYGHYDVQPVEPLELWDTPPFEATEKGAHLYGRGASDMKGQVVICLSAVQALLETSSLAVNLKFLIEGEEEIGSPALEKFIPEHKALLACDVALNADTGMMGAEIPTITYGLRGLGYYELWVYGPRQDLHSGLFGGAIHNPAQVLCDLIAGMHDDQGRVTLPGFYAAVRELSPEERAELARLPHGDEFVLEQSGAPALYGEAGYTNTERIGARPTLEINGILSGFTGVGQKTVLPSKAMAKISMRLVPNQDADQVLEQLRQYLVAKAPPTVTWELKKLSGGDPSISDIHHPAVAAMVKALETVWGVRPLYRREGGSVPVVAKFQKVLGIESVCTGFGLPDDNLHAPNEKLHLPTFYRGLDAAVHFFLNY